MNSLTKSTLLEFDYISLLIIIPLIGLSFFLVSEANQVLVEKQMIYFSISLFVFIVIIFIPIRRLSWLIPYFYWLSIVLLVLVEFIGSTKLGATRWIQVPFVSFTIQPSEIIKPIFILMLAYKINDNRLEEDEKYNFKEFMKIFFYVLLPFVLILRQPDLGTASTILLVGFAILFSIGVKTKIWLTLGFGFLISIPLIYNYGLHSYQQKRINDFLDKEPSYHIQQSIIAIGSGEMVGNTKEKSTQTHLKFLPIATSDFIFSYTCERFGFIGGAIIMFLYLFLSVHLFLLAHSLKDDIFGKVFGIGLSFLIFIHSSLNISMNIGLFPVVGLPLPFYSYGGSSFLTFSIMFALMQNLLAFKFIFLYNSTSKT